MITRSHYMKNQKLHNEYYEQFLIKPIRKYVDDNYEIDELVKLYDKDPSLNNLPGDWKYDCDMLYNCYRDDLNEIYKTIEGDYGVAPFMIPNIVKTYMKSKIKQLDK